MKVYYGWWIVLGSVVCQLVSMSVSLTAASIFMQPITADLGWKLSQFTLGSSAAVGAGALSSVFVGRFLDLRGPKLLVLIGACTSSICLFLIGSQSNLLVFITLYFIAGLIGWNLFGPPVVNATLSKWFIKNRGWALAIGSMGISFSSLLTPLLLTLIIDSLGWRSAYKILSILVIIILIPIGLSMRRRPEDYGLLPDGESILGKVSTSSLEDISITRSEALRTRSFWMLTLGFSLIMAGLMSILIHSINFSIEAGFTGKIAASALTVNGLANLIGKPIWGYGLQKFNAKLLVVMAYSLASLGVIFILATSSYFKIYILYIGFFLYGFGFGGTIPLSQYLYASYFGRRYIGSIIGAGHPIQTFFTALGPLATASWFDISGSYTSPFLLVIGLFITGAFIVWKSTSPVLQRKNM